MILILNDWLSNHYTLGCINFSGDGGAIHPPYLSAGWSNHEPTSHPSLPLSYSEGSPGAGKREGGRNGGAGLGKSGCRHAASLNWSSIPQPARPNSEHVRSRVILQLMGFLQSSMSYSRELHVCQCPENLNKNDGKGHINSIYSNDTDVQSLNYG